MTTFEQARDFLLSHRTDFDTASRDFHWPEPVDFNWALDWFDGVLAKRPESRDRTALWIVETASGSESKATFAELSRRSSQAAGFLRAQGVERGDRVLLLLSNVPALWEVMLASMKLGAVVIPATTLLAGDELEDRISRGKTKHVVTTAEHTSKFATLGAGLTKIVVGGEAPGWVRYAPESASADFRPDGPTRADDPLLLYFTSGTTSKPKLVLHSHRSYPVGHLSTMYWLGLRPGDVHLNISSPGWAKHAWSCFFAPWNAGATVFLANQPRFEARSLLDAITKARVTSLCAPPTVWRMLVQEDLKSWKTSIRELAGAGEPMNPEIIEQVREAWGLTIRDGFGQTETTAQIGNPPGQKIKLGSMGRPLPGYRCYVLDLDDHDAKEGEVCLRTGADAPAGLMQGYEKDGGVLAGTDATYYRTGDVATLDEEGYLTFVGRSDDVFKSSDYRISPFELESVLIEHPAVAEAAVVPSPDPLRLAVPKAYVALVAGAEAGPETALSIFRHTNERLSPFKRIRRLEIVTELPKTISGKIRRNELRKRENALGVERPGAEFSEESFPELKAGRGRP